MPRRPRIHLAGLPLHLVQRWGHNREEFNSSQALFTLSYMKLFIHKIPTAN